MGTSNYVNCDSALQHEKSALREPRRGHYGDYTEHEGKDRQRDRYETLGETL